MKWILMLIAPALMTGCLTTKIYPSYEEQCAQQGMVLEGVDSATGSAYVYNPVNGQYAVGTSRSNNVRCSVAKSDDEKCGIQERAKLAHEMRAHNKKVRGYNFFIGMGYFLYVVPGVAGYLHWDYETEKSRNALIAKRSGITKECEQQIAH